jgi:Tfp pilus assembly protein PilF
MAEFSFIFRTEPQYAAYHFELGRIFESMKATDRAKKEFSRALQLDPDFTPAKEALKKLK